MAGPENFSLNHIDDDGDKTKLMVIGPMLTCGEDQRRLTTGVMHQGGADWEQKFIHEAYRSPF